MDTVGLTTAVNARSLAPVTILLVLLSTAALCAGGTAPSPAPVQTIRWEGLLYYHGQAENGFFATMEASIRSDLFESWRWKDGTLVKDASAYVATLLHVALLPDGRYMAQRWPGSDGKHWPLVIGSPASDTVIKSWSAPEHWDYESCPAGISRNGRFAAVLICDALRDPPPDRDRAHMRLRLGILDISTLELTWGKGEVVNRGGNKAVSHVAVSNDGRYVGISRFDNDGTLVDTTTGKVLWTVNAAVPFTDIECFVFSTDGSRVYGASLFHDGCVLALETATGKLLAERFLNKAGVAPSRGRGLGELLFGRADGPRRPTCMALSPDDRWLAVGTMENGETFLFDTASAGKAVILRNTRGVVWAVSFSPDGKLLAVMAGGLISIWNVPEAPQAAGDSAPGG